MSQLVQQVWHPQRLLPNTLWFYTDVEENSHPKQIIAEVLQALVGPCSVSAKAKGLAQIEMQGFKSVCAVCELKYTLTGAYLKIVIYSDHINLKVSSSNWQAEAF